MQRPGCSAGGCATAACTACAPNPRKHSLCTKTTHITLQHNDDSFRSRHASLSAHPRHHPSAHTNTDKTPIATCMVRAAAGRAHVGAAAARTDAHPCTGTSCCCSADACCCSCLRCHCLLDGRLAVLDAVDGCRAGGAAQSARTHTHTRESATRRPCTAAWVSPC